MERLKPVDDDDGRELLRRLPPRRRRPKCRRRSFFGGPHYTNETVPYNSTYAGGASRVFVRKCAPVPRPGRCFVSSGRLSEPSKSGWGEERVGGYRFLSYPVQVPLCRVRYPRSPRQGYSGRSGRGPSSAVTRTTHASARVWVSGRGRARTPVCPRFTPVRLGRLHRRCLAIL